MNAAARLVGGFGKCDHVMPVLGDTLHWLPIQQRIEFKVAVLAFDCVRGTCALRTSAAFAFSLKLVEE